MSAALLSAVPVPAFAQAPPALRDPTRPPATFGAATSTVSAVPAFSFQPRQVMVVNGERQLVWNGRRYQVGDSVEGARIERIDESEIWLRDAEGTRKLALFAGVEKRAPRAAAPTKVLSDEPATSKKGQKK